MRRSLLILAAYLLIFAAVPSLDAQVNPRKAAMAPPDGPKLVTCNYDVCAQVDPATGKFNEGTNGGLTLLFAYPSSPWSSQVVFYIDGVLYSNGTQTGVTTITPSVAPTVLPDGLTIRGEYQIGEVRIIQDIKPVFRHRTTGGTSDSIGTVLYKFTIMNTGTFPHVIGMMLEFDTMVNSNDAAPISSRFGYACVEQCFDQITGIPDFFQAYETFPPEAGSLVSEGTVSGGDATPPDRLAIGPWGSYYSVAWDYTCVGNTYGDSSVLFWWDPVSVAGGSNRIIATYYGLAFRTETTGAVYTQLTGPTELGISNCAFTPDPFDLNLLAGNYTGGTIESLLVVLTVPEGLTLRMGQLSERLPMITDECGNHLNTAWRLSPSGTVVGANVCCTVRLTPNNIDTTYTVQQCIYIPSSTDAMHITLSAPASAMAGDTVQLSWAIQDTFWSDYPCTVKVFTSEGRTTRMTFDTTYTWIVPPFPMPACTVIVSATDSMCNHGADTVIIPITVNPNLAHVDSTWMAEEVLNDGRNTVHFCYLLAGNSAQISAQVSADTGRTWTIPLSTLSDATGDLGSGVLVGQHCFDWAMNTDAANREGHFLGRVYVNDWYPVPSRLTPLDSKAPTLALGATPDTVAADSLQTFTWVLSDRFYHAYPCSLKFTGEGLNQTFGVVGTSYQWTTPVLPVSACTLVVSARDSFFNWRRDTALFIVQETACSLWAARPFFPADSDTTANALVSLVWNAPLAGSPPYFYNVFVDSTRVVSGLSTTTVTLPFGCSETHSWFIVDSNRCAMDTSVARTFVTPPATDSGAIRPSPVSLISPPEFFVHPTGSITFSWNHPDTGTPPYTYTFNYSGRVGGVVRAWTAVTLADSNRYTPVWALTCGDTVRWYILAQNACGASMSDTFVVYSPTAPGTVDLVAPADGSIQPRRDVIFRWSPPETGTPPIWYRLHVQSATSGATDFTSALLDSTVYVLPESLACGDTLRWWVSDSNRCGMDTSSTWSFTTPVAPGNVVLISPPNLSNLPQGALTFSWNHPDNGVVPSYYELTVEIPTRGISHVYTVRALTYTPTDTVACGDSIRWHVTAVGECGNSTSPTWIAKGPLPPGNPILVSPPDRATLPPGNVTVCWGHPDAGTRPLSYRVHWFLHRGGAAPVATWSPSVTTTCYTLPTAMQCLDTVTWSVEVTNMCDTATSATWSFYLSTPPGPLSLISPANFVDQPIGTPVFEWNHPDAGSAPFTYDVHLSGRLHGTQRLWFRAIGALDTTRYLFPESLLCEDTVRWYVVARNACDSVVSDTFAFQGPVSPGTVPLIFPPNGTLQPLGRITLSWTDPAGGSDPFTYDLYMDSVLVRANLTATRFDTVVTCRDTVNWWVVARNVCGTSQSDTWTYTTPLPPSPVNLVSPTDYINIPLGPVSLCWDAPEYGTPPFRYTVHYTLTRHPAPPVPYDSGMLDTTCFVPPLEFVCGDTIAWFVVAENGCGTSTSATWFFYYPVPMTPVSLISPSNLAVVPADSLRFSWNHPDHGTLDFFYDLELSGRLCGIDTTWFAATTGLITNAYTWPGPVCCGDTVRWRVISHNVCGVDTSNEWTYFGPIPPGPASLISPADFSLQPLGEATLCWNHPDTGTTPYNYRVNYTFQRTDTTFTVTTAWMQRNCYPLPESLTCGDTVTWWVESIDWCDTSVSDTFTFWGPVPLNAVRPIEPFDGATHRLDTVWFSWNQPDWGTAPFLYRFNATILGSACSVSTFTTGWIDSTRTSLTSCFRCNDTLLWWVEDSNMCALRVSDTFRAYGPTNSGSVTLIFPPDYYDHPLGSINFFWNHPDAGTPPPLYRVHVQSRDTARGIDYTGPWQDSTRFRADSSSSIVTTWTLNCDSTYQGVDIAFVVDTAASMATALSAIRQNVIPFTNALSAAGITDWRLGLVTFADGARPWNADSGTTSPPYAFTSDAALFRIHLQSVVAADSSDVAQTSMDGIVSAIDSLNWRPRTLHVVIHVTDAPFCALDHPADSGTCNPATQVNTLDAINALARDSAVLFTIRPAPGETPDSSFLFYDSLAHLTGGASFDIAGDFTATFADIKARISARMCDTLWTTDTSSFSGRIECADTLFWWVEDSNMCGLATSDTFVVYGPVRPTPTTPIYPDRNAELPTGPVTITWNHPDRGTPPFFYDLTLYGRLCDTVHADTPAGRLVYADLDSPRFVLSGPCSLACGDTIFWSVTARNMCGETTSVVSSFRGPLPPGPVSLSYPPNWFQHPRGPLTLAWSTPDSNGEGARYNIHVRFGYPDSALRDLDSLGHPGLSIDFPYNLACGDTVVWWVEAFNGCGMAVSDTFRFYGPVPVGHLSLLYPHWRGMEPLDSAFYTWNQPDVGTPPFDYDLYLCHHPPDCTQPFRIWQSTLNTTDTLDTLRMTGLQCGDSISWYIVAKNTCYPTDSVVSEVYEMTLTCPPIMGCGTDARFLTPNGDLVNDNVEFIVPDSLRLDDIQVQIFNLSNRLVYTIATKPLKWDGTGTDGPLGHGLYLYLVNDLTLNKTLCNGILLLVR